MYIHFFLKVMNGSDIILNKYIYNAHTYIYIPIYAHNLINAVFSSSFFLIYVYIYLSLSKE
jgi:hypothetical protein